MSRLGPSGYAVSAGAVRSLSRPSASCEPERSASAGRAQDPSPTGRRVLVAEPYPRSKAAIEHALLGEGYRVVDEDVPGDYEAPVLLLAGDGDGLHVLEARDVAGALAGISGVPGSLRGDRSPALGIHAFVPRPFGVADVLRVARAVSGSDCRRRAPEV